MRVSAVDTDGKVKQKIENLQKKRTPRPKKHSGTL